MRDLGVCPALRGMYTMAPREIKVSEGIFGLGEQSKGFH